MHPSVLFWITSAMGIGITRYVFRKELHWRACSATLAAGQEPRFLSKPFSAQCRSEAVRYGDFGASTAHSFGVGEPEPVQQLDVE
jgi:hypothetical protein